MPIKILSQPWCAVNPDPMALQDSRAKGRRSLWHSPDPCPVLLFLSPCMAVTAWGSFVSYSTCKLFRGTFAYLGIICVWPNSCHFTLSHLATSNTRGWGLGGQDLRGWRTPLLGSTSSAGTEVVAGLLRGSNGITPSEENVDCRNTSH